MAMSTILPLLLLPILCSARNAEIVQVVSNPHHTETFESETCSLGEDCPLIGSLDVRKIALDPIATQPGTFLGLYRKIVSGTEVIFLY